MNAQPAESPALTDFIKASTLQDVQNAFVALTGVATSIRDADGNPLTDPGGDNDYCRMFLNHPEASVACRDCHTRATQSACATGGLVQMECHAGLTQYAAPVNIKGEPLAAIIIGDRPRTPLTDDQVRTVADRFGLDYDTLRRAAWGLKNWAERDMSSAIAFAQLLANTLARIWYQAHQLGQRNEELETVYRLSTLLAGERDLKEILNLSAQLVTEALRAKAAAIRLLDEDTSELRIVAVHNLSQDYLNKGPLLTHQSPIDAEALTGQVLYVEDMPTDPRTVYKEEAAAEGIHSALVTSLSFRGKNIGVMRVYTGEKRVFTPLDISLLRAVANQCAAAIIHARMRRDAREAEALERQVRLAGDVQRRMIPTRSPRHPRLDIAAIYQPSNELGGDFYDFLEFPGGNVGVAVADVVGKGVPASLTMASVRAALRAHAKSIYDIDRIMVELNRHICRDTLMSEFVTLVYGVFSDDVRTFTYCNAGHEPVLLLRDGRITPLEHGGTVLGIDREATYEMGRIDLRSGDLLVFLTDGFVEAIDYNGQAFGRARFHESLQRHASLDAQQLAQQLLWDIRRFKGLAKQSDDLTLVIAKVR